jgi:hypothetical protein
VDASPALYPLSLDLAADRVLWLRLDEAAYRRASFLDERLLASHGPGDWTDARELAVVADGFTGESDFIFHIGHVGSTLLSRLLGESARVFSLREPAILRILAREPGGMDRLPLLLRLYARTWRPEQRSLVKATSFVNAVGPAMMDASPSARAILMAVSPMTYAATMLSGPAAREGLNASAAQRQARLERRLGVRLAEVRSDGERMALGWACEIRALADVAVRFPDRVLWLDFDAFLKDPADGLAAGLNHLHGAAPQSVIGAMLASPHLRQYAKAPEHPFDAALRARILAEGWRDHRVEIERGMAWLNAAGATHPAIAEAARMAAAGSKGV